MGSFLLCGSLKTVTQISLRPSVFSQARLDNKAYGKIENRCGAKS